MPDFELVGNVHTTGPLFDGRAERAVDAFTDEVEKELAQEANRRVHRELHRVLRHPTGYYEAHVLAEPVAGRWRVHDSGVVYGPWLEGTGSRNHTTRFKGYQHWRRVKALMERDAPRLVRDMLPKLLRRLG
jgi:hypothetical protein